MAFTTTDLTNVEAAIISLATGNRFVSVTVGERTSRYAEADLDKLKTLRSMIQAELGQIYTRVYAKQGGRAS